ncbi:MAG TPA: DUF3108 domain-containing protein [Vitreimonas sp.]|uniref:DUF3108 domain-containing protein n=1 Tax=Vitreimonas sp. TaxID=3069702 RepID=UPI002D252DB5|nr:DUF3108 domain-containing protein [Vitreimonas sp.]HYD87735.1 DUF3108 domain-containing protein [Vitreimonas sp.]
MLRFLQTIACALVLVGVAAAPARAETYRLNYEAAVLGVVVLGAASYEVTASPTRYAVRANLRTSGLARLFDQTEITATSTGAIAGSAITWSRYDISHAYASKFRRIQMNRAGAAVTAQVTPRYGDLGAPPASAAQQGASFDPLTGVFALGREIGAARACRGAVLVFDGRQHYRLSVAPIGHGTFNGGGYRGPALNCRFRYEPIAGFSADFERGRVPAADAWFALPAEPGFAAPLRLTVPTPLGQAQLDLRRYERIG